MAYILLFVFLTFCTFAMSPAFGVLFLGMLVAAIVYTISDANKQYKEDIESIRVGSEKIGKTLLIFPSRVVRELILVRKMLLRKFWLIQAVNKLQFAII